MVNSLRILLSLNLACYQDFQNYRIPQRRYIRTFEQTEYYFSRISNNCRKRSESEIVEFIRKQDFHRTKFLHVEKTRRRIKIIEFM